MKHVTADGAAVHCDFSRPGLAVEWDVFGWSAITGPVAEGLFALGFALRRIGIAAEDVWEARARGAGITVYGPPLALYPTVYEPAAWTTPELCDGLPEVAHG